MKSAETFVKIQPLTVRDVLDTAKDWPVTEAGLAVHVNKPALVIRLLALSYPDRMHVLRSLKLFDETDVGVTDSELVKRVLKRAQEQDQLLQLAAAVKAASTEKSPKT